MTEEFITVHDKVTNLRILINIHDIRNVREGNTIPTRINVKKDSFEVVESFQDVQAKIGDAMVRQARSS